MKHVLIFGVVLLCFLVVAQTGNAQIRNSKHDLSSSSTTTGPKSSDLDQVCVFCHTPHTQVASTVLWNRDFSGATYTVYSSPTLEQSLGQPQGISKNCLSCHDGTVAFNSLVNKPGSGSSGTITVAPSQMDTTGWAGLGTNLTNDHPISLTYTTHQSSDGYLRAATLVNSKPVVQNAGVTLPLYGTTTANGTLECATCHDPHNTSNGTFLRFANTTSQVCFTCHTK